MSYINVDNIEDANYWIPTYDPTFKYKGLKRIYKLLRCKYLEEEFNDDILVTLNRPYKLLISRYDGEYVIVDNNGQENNLWLIHRGYFVKEL